MIKLIGLQRILVLLILLAINGGLAAGFFLIVDPMRVDAEDTVTKLDKDISSLHNKIRNVRAELKDLRAKLPLYYEMEDNHFFAPQDRFLVGKVLEDYREKTKIVGFSYVVGQVRDIANQDASKAGYRLVNSNVQVNQVSAYLDTHVFSLANVIDLAFPGRTRISKIRVTRTSGIGKEVDNDTLEKICSGKRATLVEAEVVFDWQSLLPPEEEGPDSFRDRTFRPRG